MAQKSFEISHSYGENYHVVDSLVMSTWLARLCRPDTFQPTINDLVRDLYTHLIQTVLDREFPKKKVSWQTRMSAMHPESFLNTDILDQDQKVVTVNLARAGTYPSQICYNMLNTILNPIGVRQDHILASRVTNNHEQVTGAEFGAIKIGGGIEDSIVLFPDPMGATGSTLVQAVDHYKGVVLGQAKKYIALHLIITPEYLSLVKKHHPDLIVYALRLDRGLSSTEILETKPGTFWNLEKGLNDKHYIIPGAGGLGEIMNNSFI